MSDVFDISIKGKRKKVPAWQIGDVTVISRGHMIKTAEIFDEYWLETDKLPNPNQVVAELRRKGNTPDLFTFMQRIPDVTPKYSYHLEWENFAVTRTVSHEEWYERVISAEVRKKIRKSVKKGIITEVVPFDDELVCGIKSIYDESPVRQGKRFWHYGKDIETVRQENGTYLDRSTFIGAFLDGILIGFVKVVWLGTVGSTMQVISKMQHFDKAPNNALISKTVSICASKSVEYLTYGAYSYKYEGETSSLTDFKRANGFFKMDVPRYYVPLTIKGKFMLRLGLENGLSVILPASLAKQLTELRARLYSRRG
jgi:hypothetical protein